MKKHTLMSKRHTSGNRHIWWYAIPPLGNKYQIGDEIEFQIRDYETGKVVTTLIKLGGEWLQRVQVANYDHRGYVLPSVTDCDRMSLHSQPDISDISNNCYMGK